MANSKRKCQSCGNQVRKYIILNKLAYCSFDVAVKFAYKNKSKGADIIHKAKKKVYNENKISTRKRATKEACHEYIRLRDKGKPCVCCGEPLGDDFHAGHWLESGNNPQLRYDENNIHGQRSYCNTYKGGDSGWYKENLIERIGIDSVNDLISKRGGTVKRTADDYRKIEKHFKDKILELNNN